MKRILKEVQSGEGNGLLCVGANKVTENTTIHLLGHTWTTLLYRFVLRVIGLQEVACGSNYSNAKLECELVEVRSARFPYTGAA